VTPSVVLIVVYLICLKCGVCYGVQVLFLVILLLDHGEFVVQSRVRVIEYEHWNAFVVLVFPGMGL
jgi:hypothetical protein